MAKHVQSRTRPFNYGLAIARIVFCFIVICCHSYGTGGVFDAIVLPLKPMAVPVFFSISFFLLSPSLKTGQGIANFPQRIKRLAAPFLFWGIVFGIPVLAKEAISSESISQGLRTGVLRVVFQLLCGHSYDRPLWFLFDMMLFSLSAHGLAKSVRSKKVLLLILFFGAGLSFWLCQTEFNFYVWNRFRDEIRYPLGRLCECLPYAILGLILGLFNIPGIMAKQRWIWIPLLLVLVIPIPLLSDPHHSFGDSGWTRIQASIVFPCLFFLLPTSLLPEWIKTGITNLSQYTTGIYCIHYIPASILLRALEKAELHIDPILPPLVLFFSIWPFCYLVAKTGRGKMFVA